MCRRVLSRSYSEKAKKFKKVEKKRNALQRKQLDTKLSGVERRYQDDLEHATQMQQQLASQPEYADLATMISRIKAKDAEVVGLLHAYKEKLVEQLAANRPGFTFDRHYGSGDTATASRKIAAADYAAMPIDLSWSHS